MMYNNYIDGGFNVMSMVKNGSSEALITTCNKNEWHHIAQRKDWMTTLLQNRVSDVRCINLYIR